MRCRFAQLSVPPPLQVVELINELKAKIEADGAMEQKTYDKFACWSRPGGAREATRTRGLPPERTLDSNCNTLTTLDSPERRIEGKEL